MTRWIKRLLRWDGRSDWDKSVLLWGLRYRVARAASWLPLPLPWLMRRAGTDKHWPDRPGGHRYGACYAAALRPWRWRRVRLLEIGIGGTADEVGGRSLLAWLAFFPRGRVTGCDLHDRSALARGRLAIRRMNQADPRDLQRLAAEGPFDVIIDDGSHQSAHQLRTFHALFDQLAEGGLYVIEDVQTSFWHRPVGGVEWDGAAIGSPGFGQTAVGWFGALATQLNHAEFLDPPDPALLPYARRITRITFEHNLIVATKGSNDAGSNTLPSG